MQTRTISLAYGHYPPQVREWFADKTAPTLYTSGNLDILNQSKTIHTPLENPFEK